VLEPLNGYLTLAAKLFTDGAAYAQAWNFGPDDAYARNVEWTTQTICGLEQSIFSRQKHTCSNHQTN
jgi:CDP-glucose 4,6-dehydratase